MKYSFFFLFLSICFTMSGDQLHKDGECARVMAMGGVSDIYFNLYDYLIGDDLKNTISFSHKNKFSDLVKISSLSIVFPYKKQPIFLRLTNRLIDDIDQTQTSWNDDGDFVPEPGEINYLKINQFSHNETGISITSAKLLNSSLLGYTFKSNFIKLGDYSGYGFSLDITKLKPISDRMYFLIKAEDVLAIKYWNTDSFETFSPIIKSGLFYKRSFINTSFFIQKEIQSYSLLQYQFGIEINKNENTFFRLGSSHENSFSAGFGIKTSTLDLDYAYLYPTEKVFSTSQILSVGISLDYLFSIKGKIKP